MFRLINGKSWVFRLKQVNNEILGQVAVLIPLFAVESKLPFLNVGNSVAMILWFERGYFLHQFVNKHTQGPQVNSFIIASSSKHLRGPVIRRACESEHIFAGSSLVEFTATAEIDKYRAPALFIVQNIFWLYVSMADVPFVNVF